VAGPRSEHPDAPRLVRISDLARLSGVPTPTIKHYVREGLLSGPHKRTSRNMAYYDARLAARVKVIKELQHERFLPLKLIADLLEPPPSSAIRADLDELQRRQLGELAPAIRAGSQDARRHRAAPTRRRTRSQVLAELDIGEDDLALLARLELIAPPGPRGGEPVYEGADLDLLEVIDETRRKGLGGLFPMPILEPYAAAIRTLVRVELELFRRQVLSGAPLPPMPLDEIAREATALGERLVVAMRAKLVIPELHGMAGPAAAPAPGTAAPSKAARAAPTRAARTPRRRRH
jgi:DNA-binding transcriptional MerR regulator